MKLNERTAIVVGASSGMGEAVARRLAQRGWRVALVARREDKLRAIAEDIARRTGRDDALAYAHDVTHFEEVPSLFDRIVRDLGGLGLIVYAAGIMPDVAPDEYDFQKDRAMVEVNLLGMMAWMNEAADLFRRLKRGTIVGIGSVAGDRGRKDRPAYNTSKGAQAIFLESLRNRLAAHNVRVVTIKPGPVATAMTVRLGDQPFQISASEAARQIVAACESARATVYVPRRWALIMCVIRHIPSVIFRRLDI